MKQLLRTWKRKKMERKLRNIERFLSRCADDPYYELEVTLAKISLLNLYVDFRAMKEVLQKERQQSKVSQ